MLILSLALFFRIYRLEQVPAGLFWDEISAVYTPYLHQTGLVDVSIRSVIAFVLSGTFFIYSILGPSVFFTRLPDVLLGTLLVFVTYLLAKEMFSKRVGLISALLMALSPWALHFSRFQAFSSAYVLYFTVAMLFLYMGINSSNRRMQFIWYCFGSLLLGLSANIFASSRVLVPLIVVGFLIVNLRVKPFKISSFLPEVMIYAAIFLLAYSPVFLDYLTHDPISSRALAYSTYSHSQNIFDLSRMVFERAYAHISPSFLVFTSPAAHDLPFQETISQSALLRYSPTIFGELNYYGVMLYPGILLLAYEAVKKRSKEQAVLLWWIVCYLIVSGIAYYDNPSPVRNIVGLPALIITVALVIDFLIKAIRELQIKGADCVKPILVVLLICLVAVPSGLFLNEYYVIYPAQSAKVFDYGYEKVADYLSANRLWGRDIYVHGAWGRDLTLSFYSPEQPPSNKIVCISDVKGLDPERSYIQISKDITFEQGIIEYETQIDEGYGAAASQHIFLIRDEDNALQLSIYANDSTYAPSRYLLWQKVDGKIYFEQQLLDEVIEYDKWYTIRLTVNRTTVSFSCDEKLVTTWLRPADDTYLTLKLAGESASVSLKNLKIEQNNQSCDLFDKDSFSNWATISGKTEIKQDVDSDIIVTLLPRSSDAILVTRYQERSVAFSEHLSCELLKNIYYPDGSLAFSIFELTPRSRASD